MMVRMASLPSVNQYNLNPQHPSCPLFTFGGVEGNSLLGGAEME